MMSKEFTQDELKGLYDRVTKAKRELREEFNGRAAILRIYNELQEQLYALVHAYKQQGWS